MIQRNYGWRESQSLIANNSIKGQPGLIRSIALVFLLIFALGFVDGVTHHGDEVVKCPNGTLIESRNADGGVECVLKIDRDLAKITRKVRT